MRVVALPDSLDYRSCDQLIDELEEIEGGPVLFDGHRLRWVDPNGMVNLLAAGTVVRQRSGSSPRLQLPEQHDVQGYMARMGFFEQAREIFALPDEVTTKTRGGESDVLLEITPITTNHDIHDVVDRVQRRAGTILSRTLDYPPTAVVQFSVILSEVCQNIIEHAEAPGWVAAQSYNWEKRIGRHILVIAVSDLGRGFKGSLADEHSARFGDRWGDVTALEAAFIHGLTRFPDSGRGQGIQQIRKQVRRWDGLIAIRSGTARIADVPDWIDLPPMETELTDFPGAQINIILPERIDDE